VKAVLQRVKECKVSVDNKITGHIQKGWFVLLGISRKDEPEDASFLARKTVSLRAFNDTNDKMNLSIKEINGQILVISQFTLFANCLKGRRPSFVDSAPPEFAQELYQNYIHSLKNHEIDVETGIFGKKMSIESFADGPVTLIIDTNDRKKAI
tara:strand:- start:520 stop:978 length:459 start_codon:yes stop_codon:yes gene_type:complete